MTRSTSATWFGRLAWPPNPSRPATWTAEAREWVTSQIKQGQVFSRGEQYAIEQRIQELEKDWRTIPPGHYEVYLFEGLIPPRRADAVIQVRYRARGQPMPLSEMLSIDFAFADPDTFQQIRGLASDARTHNRLTPVSGPRTGSHQGRDVRRW